MDVDVMVEHWRENTMIILLKEWHPDWLITVCTFKTNRPFYSCGLGVHVLVFEWMWGGGWYN